MIGRTLLVVSVVAVGLFSERAQAESAEPETVDEARLDELLEAPQGVTAGIPTELRPEDLESHFAREELARAKMLFDRKRHGEARALLLELGESLPVRYLRGLSALRGGKVLLGVTELEALAADYPLMRDYLLLDAARGFEQLRMLPKAQALYAQVAPDSLPFAEARFGLARVLKRQTKYEEGIAALQPLRELPDGPRTSGLRLTALLAICELARWLGDYNAEHAALLEVWATSPFSKQADVARRRLEGLPVPGKWKVRRAEALVTAHRNLEGMKLAAEALAKNPIPSPIGCRAGYVLGNALRKERKHRNAIAELSPVVTQCPLPDLRPQALFVLGYSQSVVEPTVAATTYETLANDYPSHPLADDALFFAAKAYERQGHVELALMRLSTIRDAYATSNVVAEAHFKSAWVLNKEGDRAGAVAALDDVLALEGTVSQQELLRAWYWKARLADDPVTSESLLQRLVRQHPTSYYGELARQRVTTSMPDDDASAATCTAAVEPKLEVGTLASDPHFMIGLEMLRLGVGTPVDELLAVNRKGQPESAMRSLHHLLALTGHHRTAEAVLRSTVGRELKGDIGPCTRSIWESVFPLKYRRPIRRYAYASRVDPNLLQALIREESRFNPLAFSSTGARGLTQLMMGTAKQVASTIGVGPVNERSLFEPTINIRIGATYLGWLSKQFDGRLERAVAAYNAGPTAVNRWVRSAPEASMDEWVEEISFDETREYVKKVLGSYYTYRRLELPMSGVARVADGARPVATPVVCQPGQSPSCTARN